MYTQPGVITGNAGLDTGNSTLAGNTTGSDHQLHHVRPLNIGDKTWINRGRLLQLGDTVRRFGGERPGKV